MSSAVRRLFLLSIGLLSMFAIGCGSNNKGKIVGKWKVVSATGQSGNTMKELEAKKISYFFEYKEDFSVVISFELPDNPVFGKQLQSMMPSYTFKYKLRSGDIVEFYDLPKDLQEKGGGMFGNKDRGRERIKISGDNMTMMEETGNLSLVRVK